MPTAKTLEKQIDSMTDEILVGNLSALFAGLKKAEATRVLDLTLALIEGHHGIGDVDELNWSGVSSADAELVKPLILGLSQVAEGLQNLPLARQRTVIDRAKLVIYYGGK